MGKFLSLFSFIQTGGLTRVELNFLSLDGVRCIAIVSGRCITHSERPHVRCLATRQRDGLDFPTTLVGWGARIEQDSSLPSSWQWYGVCLKSIPNSLERQYRDRVEVLGYYLLQYGEHRLAPFDFVNVPQAKRKRHETCRFERQTHDESRSSSCRLRVCGTTNTGRSATDAGRPNGTSGRFSGTERHRYGPAKVVKSTRRG